MGPKLIDMRKTLHRLGAGGKKSLRDGVVSRLGGELDPSRVANGEDLGMFGPQSSAWVIHADACLIIGGVAALLHQMLHPLAMAGVADHSSYRTDPWGRLHRTSSFLAEVIYGDSTTAKSHIEHVKNIHTRIKGTAPDGRPYRADDPVLLEYIHVTEVRAFLRSYQRYGASTITQEAADRYVAEMGIIAKGLGALDVPMTVRELDAKIESYTPSLSRGVQAAEALQFLRNPGLTLLERGAYQIIFDAAAALLEQKEAELLGVERERRRGAWRIGGQGAAGAFRWVLGPSPVVQAARRRTGNA